MLFRLRGAPLRLVNHVGHRNHQFYRAIGTLPTNAGTLGTESQLSRPAKAIGDISSIFPSLSGNAPTPLPPRFAAVKANLIAKTDPEKLQASWDNLIAELDAEIAVIARKGSDVIPKVDFSDLKDAERDERFLEEVKRRGTVLVKGVISEGEALEMKEAARRYIRENEGRVKAFPASNPSVYEIYWSAPQIRARTHPRLLTAQRFLLSSLFEKTHSTDPIDLSTPVAYADRLRIRPPGDAGFALGPHIDAGSVERWEDPTYASTYNSIWQGNWQQYSPFSRDGVLARENAQLDMYNGAGACSMLRLWQGWLSLSDTSPGEGTLRVFPLLKHSTAYILLRPFFSPSPTSSGKWNLDSPTTSSLPGSIPGFGQELNPTTHPHLKLSEGGMVSIPHVKPGDYVAWHGDVIHAVESIHSGKGDSSVFYIPAVPASARNLEFLSRQRDAMESGGVPPDFPGAGVEGQGEAGWKGRGGWGDVHQEGDRSVLGWGLSK